MQDRDLGRKVLQVEVEDLRRRVQDLGTENARLRNHIAMSREETSAETVPAVDVLSLPTGAEPRETEEDYFAVVQTANEAICIIQDGYLRFVNPACTHLTGYSKEELLSRPFAAFIPPEDLPILTALYIKRLQGEYLPRGHRFRIIIKSGVTRWAESWSASITRQGQPAVLSMIRDVDEQVRAEERLRRSHEELDQRVQERTAKLEAINEQLSWEMSERKQAELSLSESERRIRKLMDHSPMGIAVTDRSGEVKYLNQKFTELLGYTLEDIPTLDQWWRLAYPDQQYADHVRSAWLSSTESVTDTAAEAEPVEREIRCKDGTIRIIDVRKTFIDTWAIHTFIDVTEKKRQDQALFESEQMFRLLSEQSLMSVAVLQDGVYKYANQAMSDLCEYSIEQILSWKFEEFLEVVHPTDRSLVMEQSRKKQAGHPRQKTLYSFRIITRSGKTKWVEIYSKTVQFKGDTANLITMLDVTERITAEKAMRRSEERLRLAWQTSPDGLSISTLQDGTYVDVNDGYTFITGYTSHEIVGKSAVDVGFWAHNDDRPLFVDQLNRHGRVRNFETTLRRKDGKTRAILISAGLMTLGGVQHLLAVTKDVEDLKRSEAALRESEQKYRLLADNGSDVIWIVDLDLRITYISPSVERLSGWSVDEYLALKPSDYLTPSSLNLAANFLKSEVAIQQTADLDPNRVITIELEQYRKTGETFWSEVSARFLYNEAGNVSGVIGSTRDITDRRRSQEQLQRLFAAVQQAGETIMITEPDGVILYVNPAFENTTGWPIAEVIGRRAEILKIGKHNKTFYEEMWSTMRRGEVWRGRFTNQKRDGTLYEETATISPIKDESDRITNYVIVARDVTSEVMLQRQLLHAQKMEAVGAMAGGIAHDLNNMLQVVLACSDLLLIKKRSRDPDSKKVEMIRKAALDGADLVARILTFSRKGEFKTRPVDLNSEIREAQKLLHRTMPRMIETKFVLADDLKIIHADPAQVKQVLLNLAVNSQHAMPEGGKLIIETTNASLSDEYLRPFTGALPGHYVLLTVSDTGIGIRADLMDRIFEPFFTTKIEGEGTGLGLAVVHGIVSQHGGYIRCHSELGLGTTFHIYWPVSEHEFMPETTRIREIPAFGSETILFVDDDDGVRETGRQILEMSGYRMLAARSGEEALEAYKNNSEKISLVILDLIMPGMGGSRCLEELLRINPAVKIIVASGYSSNGLVRDETARGARGFLSKPYDAKEILTAIRTVLDKGTL